MNIVEIFYSLQGEGRLTGVPSVFIRVAGCPVRCTWCDSKYAWDEFAGEELSVEQIVGKVEAFDSKFVVVTGGEPMVNQHLPLLAAKLAHTDRHITVETSGIAFIPDLPVDLMSISPKLSNAFSPNAAITRHHNGSIQAVKQLVKHYDYQLKFVIDIEDDIAEVTALVHSIKDIDPGKVMLMPQAKTRDELLAKSAMVGQLCTRYGFNFGQRLQVLLWDNQRGK
jgi:7-carboxy-7-deazaguanine synthase